MSVEMFGTGREDIKSSKFKSYKGKGGQTDMIGIIFKEKDKMYCGAKTHYKDRYFICKSTKEQKAVCCTSSYKNNTPKYRIGAVIIVYQIGKDPETGKQKLLSYELVPWIFSETMYDRLNEIDSEFPLETHDLKLKCTNEDFQNMDVTPCKTSIWRNNEKLKAQILEKFESIMDEGKKNLGSNLNIEEIKELLGVESPGSEDAAVDVSVGDVLDGV